MSLTQWIWWQKIWATSPASPIQRAAMCQRKSPRELQPRVEGAVAEDAVAEEDMEEDVAPMTCSVMTKSSTATTHPMSGGTG